MFLPKILIALAFCAGTLTATAQTAKKISTLKSQRANLQKKIKENEGMLKTLKKDVRSQLNNLSVLNGQINSQKKLVDAISSDVGQMDSMITSLNTQRTTQNKLMFIFSADNFTQMYRRLRYVRQYAEYQRIQGELVQRKQEQIQNKRNEISQARAEKGALLDQGKQEQAKLESKHAERKKLVSKLQKQQRKVQSTLQANKKQYNSLNAQIDKLIQQQIAEERRRREEARKRELERQRRLAAANKKKSRSSKSKSSSKRSSERSSEEKREQMAVFEMEKADRALSNNFASNRGRLPVPITGSYMITTHYGQYTPDGLKGVQLDSKGISITGKSGARARAIFDGEVSAVFSFGGMTNVLVRHGSYISVYCNLSSSSVRKGQKVSTRDIIGPIARDASGNCTMHFQLRKETSKLNPESWLNL